MYVDLSWCDSVMSTHWNLVISNESHWAFLKTRLVHLSCAIGYLTEFATCQWDHLFEEIVRVMKPGAAFEVRDFQQIE